MQFYDFKLAPAMSRADINANMQLFNLPLQVQFELSQFAFYAQKKKNICVEVGIFI